MARIDRTTLLAAVRECVTVVEPGDLLAVRVGYDTTDAEFAELTEFSRRIRDVHGVGVVFIAADEFARLKAAGAS